MTPKFSDKKATMLLPVVLIALVFIVVDYLWVDPGYRAASFESGILTLPNKLAYADALDVSFLDEEAGMAIYLDTNQQLDLSLAKDAYKTVEQETSDYLIGSVSLSGLPASDDVHCYTQADGLIVVYYLASEPASKIVDWNFYSEGSLTSTKLHEGLATVCDALGLTATDAQYYNFKYPYATNMMIIVDSDSFNLSIPAGISVYERSWAHIVGEASVYGSLSASQLSLGTFHIIGLNGRSWECCPSGSENVLNIDESKISGISGSSAGKAAIVLLYRNPQ